MTDHAPNTQLKALLVEAKLTYAATAHAVRAVAAEVGVTLATSKAAVHHWAAYGTTPEDATARYLAEALSRRLGRRITRTDLGLSSPPTTDGDSIRLGPNPVEVLTTIGEADVRRRRILTASAYSLAAAVLPLHDVRETAERTAAARRGATIGTTEVDAARTMVETFAALDERLGGQHGRTAWAQYLITDILPLCQAPARTEALHRQMLSVAASAAHLAGWRAYDSGEQGLAQHYYLQSYKLAVTSNEPGQGAFVLRTMAQQALKLHHPAQAVELATASLSRAAGAVPARVEALHHITHAHVAAHNGDQHAARNSVDRAHAALEAGRGEDVPPWSLAWGPPEGTVASRTAKVYQALGMHRHAADHHTRAAASRPVDTYARIIGLDLAAAAESHLALGNLEEACATWSRALDHLHGVRSARTRTAIADIRRDLAPFRARGVRCARELDERAATLLRKDR